MSSFARGSGNSRPPPFVLGPRMIVRNVPLISLIATPRVLVSKAATTAVKRGGDTVKNYLQTDETELTYARRVSSSKLNPQAESRLSGWE